MYTRNSVFYSPNMLQFCARRSVNKNNEDFVHRLENGRNRLVRFEKYTDKMMMEDCNKFLELLRKNVNNDTVPEFGNFAPIASNMKLQDNSGLVFQIRPVEKHPERKELTTSFINSKTGGIVSRSRLFGDKQKLLEYINSIDEDALKKIVMNCIVDTE